ncbi:MAG: ribonuclease R [Pseudomonadales bacterium]|nr:ribonuclease R [Pseudomonadales bacterium]
MPKSKKPNDPYASREAGRYDNPIPSREFIQEHLKNRKGPANFDHLVDELGLTSEGSHEALGRRLKAMVRDGQLLRNRRDGYAPVDKLDLIKGRVQGHRDGFGFLIPEDGSSDYYLGSRQMEQVFDGDIVLAREKNDKWSRRREAAIVEVVERSIQRIVGRYFEENGISYVTPESRRISQDVMIPPDARGDAKHGQYVLAEITEQPGLRHRAMGNITEVLGEASDPGVEVEVAIRQFQIPHTWGDDVEEALQTLAEEVREQDKFNRFDLRDLPFVTIDGEDARDFDDAVYCHAKKSGGWTLFVAIADVSHYIQPGSALDREAIQRGTSVYFPDHVVPMLPELLSNGLCSLKPKVDRLCMVCELSIGPAGRVGGYEFYEAVMHSQARLTYNQVGAFLDDSGSAEAEIIQKLNPDLIEPIEELHKLYGALRSARSARGTIDFDTVETRIVFGENRKIEEIVPTTRNDAHKIIEECMLAANVATARFLEKSELECLYRVHETPSEEKLKNLREFLGELGLSLGGGNKPKPREYQTLLSSILERPDFRLIQTVMLRSLKQAVYQPENLGHFGLAYSSYAHFTSPIRRYPDLLVHRAIRSLIRSEKPIEHVKRFETAQVLTQQQSYPYGMAEMLQFGEHSSMTERRADEATRDVTDWLKCVYVQDRVGEEFEGIVTAVTSFGLFVELENLYVEGLVHITALANDYYHFDKVKHRLVGERTGKVFRLGDSIRVRVMRVSVDEKKIDFEAADGGSSSKGGKGAGRGKSPGSEKRKGPGKARGKNSRPNNNRNLGSSERTQSAVEGSNKDEARKESNTRTAKTKRKPSRKNRKGKAERNAAAKGISKPESIMRGNGNEKSASDKTNSDKPKGETPKAAESKKKPKRRPKHPPKNKSKNKPGAAANASKTDAPKTKAPITKEPKTKTKPE